MSRGDGDVLKGIERGKVPELLAKGLAAGTKETNVGSTVSF